MQFPRHMLHARRRDVFMTTLCNVRPYADATMTQKSKGNIIVGQNKSQYDLIDGDPTVVLACTLYCSSAAQWIIYAKTFTFIILI